MNIPIPALKVQITKTADGKADYIQILSADQFSINIVLIANSIEVRDQRPPKK